MSEDKQKEEVQKEAVETTTPEEKPKSNLMKYIIFGVSGLVAIVAIAFGIGLMLKEEPITKVEQSNEIVSAQDRSHTETDSKENLSNNNNSDNHANNEKDNTPTDSKNQQQADDMENVDEFVLNEEDKGAIDKIVNNLAFLDYQPSEDEIANEDTEHMQDSIEKVDWFEQENKKLDIRQKELNKKERELIALEKSVDAKIIRIEQAESNRTSQLAKLYDGMDSRAVAKLMMNLDNGTVVSILPRMNSKTAAQVLQLIPSQRAAVLSKEMITIADR